MLNIMHSGHSGSGYVTCKGDTEYHFLILVLREQPRGMLARAALRRGLVGWWARTCAAT